MKTKDFKKEKAITLVALIITIIVLLILAMVSISLVINSGIITKSKSAVDRYSDEEVQEMIKTGYSEYKMSQFTGQALSLREAINHSGLAITDDDITGEGPWTITVGDKSYTLAVDGTVTPSNSSSGSGQGSSSANAVYTVGQEVTVGGENFYVLEASDSSQSTVTLLAKYSLNQAGTAQAPNASHDDTKCVFSSTNYWASAHATYYNANDNGWNPSPKEEATYQNSWTGSQWTKPFLNLNKESEYDFASSSGDAIYKAKAYATSKGGTNGRLLTYEEADSLKTSYSDIIYGKANQPEGDTNALFYWLSSASENSDSGVKVVDGAISYIYLRCQLPKFLQCASSYYSLKVFGFFSSRIMEVFTN